MKSQEIINEIAQRTGIELARTETILNVFIDTVEEKLINQKTVHLSGFGSFKAVKRAVKKARDINKNTEIIVPEHFIPAFKPSPKFRNVVKNNNKINSVLL